MNRRERTIQRIAWLLIAVGATIFVSRNIPHYEQLSTRSSRIADATRWKRDYAGYFWQTNDTVVAVEDGGARIEQINVAGGRNTPLTALSARLANARPNTETWRLSPDGQWLLAEDWPMPSRVTAYSLDGRHAQTWPVYPGSSRYIHWLPGGKEWVELRPTGRGTLLPVLHGRDGKVRMAAHITGQCDFPICVTPQERLVSAEELGKEVILLQYSLGARPGPVLKSHIPIRSGTSAFEAEASHSGTRIAFLIHHQFPPSPLRFMGLFIPALRDNGYETDVWVANTDGSGLKRLGQQRGDDVSGLQWTPDDSKLSMFIGNSLNTIGSR